MLTPDVNAVLQLKLGNQILAEEKHKPLFKVRSFCSHCRTLRWTLQLLRAAAPQELSDRQDTQYLPGGATQNSIRVAQWLLQVSGATSYLGCIGSDKFGDIMKQTALKGGVNVSSNFPRRATLLSGTSATLRWHIRHCAYHHSKSGP